MKNKLNIFYNKEVLTFFLIGIMLTPVGIAIMFTIYNVIGLNYWLSTALSYVITSTLSFLLNKYLTFSVKKWSLYYIFAYIVNIACCYFLANFLAKRCMYWLLSSQTQIVRDNVSMFVGMILFSVLNYLGQKYVVYKHKNDKD